MNARILNEPEENYEPLSFDCNTLAELSNHPADIAELFESSKFCKKCERRVFDMYMNDTGQICIRIKCARCKKVVSIPVITLN